MTDRLYSCKDAPDGKHVAEVSRSSGLVTCRYCRRLLIPTPARAGWNVTLDDSDAHLGSVDSE